MAESQSSMDLLFVGPLSVSQFHRLLPWQRALIQRVLLALPYATTLLRAPLARRSARKARAFTISPGTVSLGRLDL